MELHFFIGKGGVGKSTVSALSALAAARSGRHTLLVSMDPAHNQEDIFGCSLGSRPRQVRPRLRVCQVDTRYWVDAYLKDTLKEIRKTYSYQGAYNLTQTFDILRLSPGLEGYGLVLAFERVIQKEAQAGAVYFDMPPTARTLDFFTLPDTVLAWVEALLGLREAILAKKQIVSRIKGQGKTRDPDRVRSRLEQMIKNNQRLKDCLSGARLHLVMNPDPLSLAEAARFQTRLGELGYAISSLVLNKALFEDTRLLKSYGLEAPMVQFFPLSQGCLAGLKALDSYLTGVCRTAFGPSREEESGMVF